MMKPFASVRALAGAFALGLLVAACGQSEPETKTTEAMPASSTCTPPATMTATFACMSVSPN